MDRRASKVNREVDVNVLVVRNRQKGDLRRSEDLKQAESAGRSQYERFIGGTLAASFSSNVAICTALVPNVTS